LATRQSGWLPWAPKHYFDRSEFETDLRRLQAFYADRGYPSARVSGVDVKLNDARDAVDLIVKVNEGAPVVVDAVRTEGFDDLPADLRRALDDLPLKAGAPRDREVLRASRDFGARLLRDNGYAHAGVDAVETAAAESNHVVVTLRAAPGPKCYFGDVSITGLQSVGENVVRRELAFAPGDLYRESEITKTQQRLTALELFEFAHVDPRVAEDALATRIPVRVTVAEGKPQRLKLGLGYGSEERVRGLIEWNHMNFLGGARHGTANAKWSSIDRGIRVIFIEPYFLHKGLSFNLSGTVWHTSQLSYETGTYGGRATVAYHSDGGVVGPREPVHREVRVAYVNEYVRYGILKTALTDLSRHEERIALGLDPVTGRGAGRMAGIDADFERIAVDDALNPHRGTIGSLHLEHIARALGGTYHFDEAQLEGRAFVPFGKSVVLANRARFGVVMSKSPSDMPFSERYFLGGSSSVRGWGRFQISPLNEDGLPIGGRSMVELSSELRFPLRGRLSGVMFVDAGNVWADRSQINLSELRCAIGPGLRYLTPVGPIRADFGIQLNPIRGLVINGLPEQRQWRIHFSIGQSF
jgi:outer membrane protein insertion porin family/translocation and assembly module TamA